MSRETLKAIIQLFAVLSSYDEGIDDGMKSYARSYLLTLLTFRNAHEFYQEFIGFSQGATESRAENKDLKPQIEEICGSIKRSLNNHDRIIVLNRIAEFIYSNPTESPQRVELLKVISNSLNISEDVVNTILLFNRPVDAPPAVGEPNLLYFCGPDKIDSGANIVVVNDYKGIGLMLYVAEHKILLFRILDPGDEVLINGVAPNHGVFAEVASASVVKLGQSAAIYYDDIINQIASIQQAGRTNFVMSSVNVSYKFANGKKGTDNVSFSAKSGQIVGLMGSSGSGKTTLLNILSGIDAPHAGEVQINGLPLKKYGLRLQGAIGYVPQEDLLFEDLSVFQNVYYNVKFCFNSRTKEENKALTLQVLDDLGLGGISHLKVGHAMNKSISGGQRKRLNIGLELLRSPEVLFLDEPTSGLSSKDSQNVLDLLRTIAGEGKLVFLVIHQPSSDLYKMLDKVLWLDVGGKLIYFGNPIEAVTYFKKETLALNEAEGECNTCGTVSPDQVFDIIEAKELDENGNESRTRRILANEWQDRFNKNRGELLDESEQYAASDFAQDKQYIDRPGKLKQMFIYIKRDVITKLSNVQYLGLTLLVCPLLAFIIAFITKKMDYETGVYSFYHNENIPAYLFMLTIVATFVGMVMSAEEIFKDRKILKRERFLHLSKSAYLSAKVAQLIFISALQALLLVFVGNYMIEMKNMFWSMWMTITVLFVMGNIAGLILSATFNSPVTIYILIPIVLIPQMLLGGALIDFKSLNQNLGGDVYRVPVIANFMSTRWAYESLMVTQFVDNDYNSNLFDLDRNISHYDYMGNVHIPYLFNSLEYIGQYFHFSSSETVTPILEWKAQLIQNEINFLRGHAREHKIDELDALEIADIIGFRRSLDSLQHVYNEKLAKVYNERQQLMDYFASDKERKIFLRTLKDEHSNQRLSDIVKDAYSKNKIHLDHDRLVQVSDPVYQFARKAKRGNDLMYVSEKKIVGGFDVPTFYYNLAVNLLYFMISLVVLYTDLVAKCFNLMRILTQKLRR